MLASRSNRVIALSTYARTSLDVRDGGVFARQEQILEKERGEVAPAIEARLPVDGQRLLADGALAGVPELGNGAMPEPFQLQQRDLALGACQPPAIELAIDGASKALERRLRLGVPSAGVLARLARLGPHLRQLEIELRRLAARRGHLPPVKRHARQRGGEDAELEEIRKERLAFAHVDHHVDGHQRGNDDEQKGRRALAAE